MNIKNLIKYSRELELKVLNSKEKSQKMQELASKVKNGELDQKIAKNLLKDMTINVISFDDAIHGIVNSLNSNNGRKIVCLCGSTKFKEAFEKANREESAKGNIVLTVAMYGHADGGLDMNSKEKETFDEVHKDKIEMCDEVLVLNVNNYIGDSTKSEIAHAKKLGKKIRYLEKRK